MYERLIKNTDAPETEQGCWLWNKGLTHDGYGRLNAYVGGRHRCLKAHRVSFAVFNAPEGIDWRDHIATLDEVGHLCHVRRCCNPDHLEQMTHRQNLDERNARQGWAQ